MTAAALEVINGVRVGMVAMLVAGTPHVMASSDERRIALKVQRIGEKLERKGYLPALRRRTMLAAIAREARLVVADLGTINHGTAPQNEV